VTSFAAHDVVWARFRESYGLGHVEWVSPDGRVLVSFEVDGRLFTDDFAAGELRRAEVAKTG
jgi:hypothetical protein